MCFAFRQRNGRGDRARQHCLSRGAPGSSRMTACWRVPAEYGREMAGSADLWSLRIWGRSSNLFGRAKLLTSIQNSEQSRCFQRRLLAAQSGHYTSPIFDKPPAASRRIRPDGREIDRGCFETPWLVGEALHHAVDLVAPAASYPTHVRFDGADIRLIKKSTRRILIYGKQARAFVSLRRLRTRRVEVSLGLRAVCTLRIPPFRP